MADIRSRSERSRTQPSRLISIIPVDNADGSLDLIYMFQRGAEVDQYCYQVKVDEELEALSDRYKGALNMERECIDPLGVCFRGVSGRLFIEPESGIKAALAQAPAEPEAGSGEGWLRRPSGPSVRSAPCSRQASDSLSLSL